MQKLKFIIVAAGLITVASACKMDRHQSNRHVVIAEDSNNNYLKIEYSGRAMFNSDGTAIASITPNGYIKYRRNNRELTATSDYSGIITYEIDHDNKSKILNAADRVFLAQAVQDMIKHGHYNDSK